MSKVVVFIDDEKVVRDALPEDIPAEPTPEELEGEVQRIADELTSLNERDKALAMATVDLRMADITGLTTQEVRQAFRDRVVFYLRQERGI